MVKRTTINFYVRERALPGTAKMQTSKAVAEQMEDMVDSDREIFVVFLLNAKNGIVGKELVSVGTATGALVHPREVFKPAILHSACAVVIGHNHPSGDPLPSLEDRMVTKRLIEAGTLLGINVLDHVIIGSDDYYSFADMGEMN